MGTKKATSINKESSDINISVSGSSIGYTLEGIIPKFTKMGRAYEVKRREIQNDLFAAIDRDRDRYTITLGGQDCNITPLSLKRVDFALREILSNQSYQNNNLDQHTGLAKFGVLSPSPLSQITEFIPPETIEGKTYYAAEIIVKVSDLANMAFGKSDFKTKKIVENVLAALRKGIKIRNSNGDELVCPLVHLRYSYYDKKTNAKTLDLILHPLYAKDVKNNYALHQQGILNLIGKVTDEKLDLLSLLGMQDKRKPFYRHFSTLLKELNLEEEYRKNRKRAKKKLTEAITAMVDAKILTEYPEEKKDPKGEVVEYVFHLNPDYAK